MSYDKHYYYAKLSPKMCPNYTSLYRPLFLALKWPINPTNCQPAALMISAQKEEEKKMLGSPTSWRPADTIHKYVYCVRSLWPYKSVWNTVKFVHNNRIDEGNAYKKKYFSPSLSFPLKNINFWFTQYARASYFLIYLDHQVICSTTNWGHLWGERGAIRHPCYNR